MLFIRWVLSFTKSSDLNNNDLKFIFRITHLHFALITYSSHFQRNHLIKDLYVCFSFVKLLQDMIVFIVVLDLKTCYRN